MGPYRFLHFAIIMAMHIVNTMSDSEMNTNLPYDGPTASNPAELFQQIDTNGDGKISFQEAAVWFAKISSREENEVLHDLEFRLLFNQVDTDRDGFIQPEEMNNSLEEADVI